MDVEQALKLWGASKLPKTAFRYRPTGYGEPEEPITVDPDTVHVSFVFDKGYACCGGTDPNCYCSMAESPTAEVQISATGTFEDGTTEYLYHTIEIENFDFVTTVNEMVAIANGQLT